MLVWMAQLHPDELNKDCTQCRKDRCFNHVDTIVIKKAQQLPPITITRDTWEKCADACAASWGVPCDDYRGLVEYGVCRRSVVTALSLEAWKLFMLTGGINVRTPAEYYDLSAFWTDICTVIGGAMQEIKAQQVNNG